MDARKLEDVREYISENPRKVYRRLGYYIRKYPQDPYIKDTVIWFANEIAPHTQLNHLTKSALIKVIFENTDIRPNQIHPLLTCNTTMNRLIVENEVEMDTTDWTVLYQQMQAGDMLSPVSGRMIEHQQNVSTGILAAERALVPHLPNNLRSMVISFLHPLNFNTAT